MKAKYEALVAGAEESARAAAGSARPGSARAAQWTCFQDATPVHPTSENPDTGPRLAGQVPVRRARGRAALFMIECS